MMSLCAQCQCCAGCCACRKAKTWEPRRPLDNTPSKRLLGFTPPPPPTPPDSPTHSSLSDVISSRGVSPLSLGGGGGGEEGASPPTRGSAVGVGLGVGDGEEAEVKILRRVGKVIDEALALHASRQVCVCVCVCVLWI